MADYQYTEFPIDADEIDIDQLQQDVQNVTDDILNINQAIESINQRITALTNRTINGYDLSADRTLFAQDIPSKNLLPNTATTRTVNGVTFTVNSDGSISTSGTASSGTQFTIGSLTLKSGIQYAFNGCPSGGDLDSYFINFSGVVNDTENGATATPANDVTTNAVINIVSGTNVNGKVFRPMIRLASVEDDTYVPYAKTNVELTKDASKSIEISAAFDVGNLNANCGIFARALGNIVLVTGYLNSTVAISNNTYIATIGVKPIQEVMESPNGSNGSVTRMVLRSNGRIQIESAIPANEWFSFTFIAFTA